MIRVGRRVYRHDGTYYDPHYEGFTPIICLSKSSPYGSIGPYCLKTPDGCFFENYYQFSRLYENVPKCDVQYSRYTPNIRFTYNGGVHVDHGIITEEYWNWRRRGMFWKSPVRYPCGFNGKSNGLCAILQKDSNYQILGYIESRKQIYLPLYAQLIQGQSQFLELKERHQHGENLLIIEVDGPHQEDLDYYMEKYHVGADFIEHFTMLVNQQNIQLMLNDTKHPFGHGYCLAMSILDKQEEWNGGQPPEPDHMLFNKGQYSYKIIQNAKGFCVCQLGQTIRNYTFKQINSTASITQVPDLLDNLNF